MKWNERQEQESEVNSHRTWILRIHLHVHVPYQTLFLDCPFQQVVFLLVIMTCSRNCVHWFGQSGSLHLHKARGLPHTCALSSYNACGFCHEFERVQFLEHLTKLTCPSASLSYISTCELLRTLEKCEEHTYTSCFPMNFSRVFKIPVCLYLNNALGLINLTLERGQFTQKIGRHSGQMVSVLYFGSSCLGWSPVFLGKTLLVSRNMYLHQWTRATWQKIWGITCDVASHPRGSSNTRSRFTGQKLE